MADKIGIVYASVSGMIRRIIIPDDDSQLQDVAWTGAGETLLIAPRYSEKDPAPPDHVTQQLKAAIGKEPPQLVCAVVENDTVVQMILADPALDDGILEGKKLVAAYSKEIAIGHAYDAATDLFTAPEVSVKAGTDPKGNPIQARTEPAKVIAKPEPVKDEPVKDEPVKDEPVKDEPVK